MSDSGAGPSDGAQQQPRRVRLHQVMRPLSLEGNSTSTSASGSTPDSFSTAARRRLAEILPGLADLPIPVPGPANSLGGPLDEKARLRQTKEEVAFGEALELSTIFDMGVPHPVDTQKPADPWTQSKRPTPRKIVLSQYQYEMINYQRMLLRKNIWYYRDRMSVPRGPCPLHVLKECWVQGVIDENTMMWGHGLYDWLPARNIKLLLPMILTPEVRLGAWIKKTFSLKPSLNRIREVRKEDRDPLHKTNQVDRMY